MILIVRENKTYDGVLGDRRGPRQRRPVAHHGLERRAAGPDLAERARPSAAAFTNFDNFYTDAEQSIQGHTWTVFGRTTDFMERTWLSIWGRGTRNVATDATPSRRAGGGRRLPVAERDRGRREDMGEIVGDGPLDTAYPGIVYAAEQARRGQVLLRGRARSASAATSPRSPTWCSRTTTPTAARPARRRRR